MARWPTSCAAAPERTPAGRSQRTPHERLTGAQASGRNLTAHLGAEDDRAGTGALAEELGEVAGAGEAKLGRNLRGGPVAVRQQAAGLEDYPAVDEVLRADARRGHRRPGEGARRVPEPPRVALHPADAGEIALDGVAELQEDTSRLPVPHPGWAGQVSQSQQQRGQEVTQDRNVDVRRKALGAVELPPQVPGRQLQRRPLL